MSAGHSDLAGLKLLVSAGGTREPIDSVRFLGNRSSGKMGVAIVERAIARGAEVTLVAANIAVPIPDGVNLVRVETAAQVAEACFEAFAYTDILVMAAAVADFRPKQSFEGKIKKDQAEVPVIELEPTLDVLCELGKRRSGHQTLVGFAAEHGERGREYARGKLVAKNVDLIVLNDVSQPGIAFEASDNAVTLVGHDGDIEVARADKLIIADAILDAALQLHLRLGRSPVCKNSSMADFRSAYELYQSGAELLEHGDTHAAALALSQARDLEPDSPMIREALGRALFGSHRFGEAAAEFKEVVAREPINDYGQFCLGRSLQMCGKHVEAHPPLTMATLLRPDRSDYRLYCEQNRQRLPEPEPNPYAS